MMHIGFNNQINITCSILVVLNITEYSWSGSALYYGLGGLELHLELVFSSSFFLGISLMCKLKLETYLL